VAAVPLSATAPTVSEPTAGVSAKGDPHLVNVYGQRFDLAQPGSHTMILIPRRSAPSSALLDVAASVHQIGGHCADIYIRTLTISGRWVEEAQPRKPTKRSLRYSALEPIANGDGGTRWKKYGHVQLKVVWGRTGAGVRYLNLLVRNLNHAGHSVGGLLGEDDHAAAAQQVARCRRSVSL
jgi:hypothetical protein